MSLTIGGGNLDLKCDLDVLEGPGEDALDYELVLPDEAGVDPRHLRGEQCPWYHEGKVALEVALAKREAALVELTPSQLLFCCPCLK